MKKKKSDVIKLMQDYEKLQKELIDLDKENNVLVEVDEEKFNELNEEATFRSKGKI